MKAHYLLQIIYSISQLTALVYCTYKAWNHKTKQLYLLSILLTFSFLQSLLQIFFESNTFKEYSISAYIIVEFFIHSSIIEHNIEKKLFLKYYSILKYLCIGFILFLAFSKLNYFPNNSWISHIPDTIILFIGIIALNNLMVRSPVSLLKSFEFWILYSFIFIRLSLIPIEAIDYLYLNKFYSDSRMLWIKSHQYIYLIYHAFIIYSLKWIRK